MILVSPTEPLHVRAMGKVSSTPENSGCDVLIVSRRKKLGIQRKRFPEDLIASLEDGRLSDQLTKMASLDRACVVLIGYPRFTGDGELVYNSYSQRTWTFGSIWGAVASMALEARVGTFWVRDEQEFVALMGVLEGWNGRERHTTVSTRSRPKAKGWGISRKVQEAHFLQGLPGVGPELAERIVERFGGLPLKWAVTPTEMMTVPGVGKQKVEKMREMVGFDE
jgi:DNA excision repair protein ERCC-4